MSFIRIERLFPTSGAAPSEGYDPVSGAAFTRWEIGNEARFSAIVPETYVQGNDFFLKLQESSPSVAARHQWQVKTLLIRPGVNVTSEQAVAEGFSAEFLSATTADQLTTRTIKVSGSAASGKVSGIVLQPGDYLSWTLKRIAASLGDDPSAIKVFALSLEVATDETAVSDCPGRVGRIIDTVRDLFNESNGGFLSDAFILRSVNRCLQDLAQSDYWRKEAWIPATAGQTFVDLLSAIPDYQAVHQVRYGSACTPMVSLGSYAEYDELRTLSTIRGVSQYYVVQNTGMHVWPAPSSDSQSGFCIYHSYMPPELTCVGGNSDPPVPRAHDMIFAYFVLRQAFLRDRHAPGADAKFQEYSMLYERGKQALLSQGDPPALALRPRR